MSANRDRIIVEIYESESFNNLIDKMDPPHLRDDLKSEVVLYLLNKPEDFILDLKDRGVLPNYVSRVTVKMMTQKNNDFCRQFRQSFTSNIPEVQYEQMNGRVQKELKEEKALSYIHRLYWYEREMVKLYLRFGSYRLVSKETGIPFRSCGQTIKTAIQKIRNYVNS